MDAQRRTRTTGHDYGLFEACDAAARWLRDRAPAPARVRVVGDDDSDGVSSAHVLSTALRRAGYEVDTKVRAVHTERDVAAALTGTFDAYLIADAGSALLQAIDQRGVPVLVLDHHAVTGYHPRHAHEVNPRKVGGDRTWHVSASVVCALFAVALEARNWDLAYAGLAGGVSDRQHLGGYEGLMGYLVEGSARAGNVHASPGLTLDGPTVHDAVLRSLDPYLADHTGNADATTALLARLGVDASADPLRLPDAQARSLAADLTRSLETRGVVADRMSPLYGPRLILRHPSGIPTVTALAKLLEAATAAHAHELALRILAGSADAAHEARIVWGQRHQRILEELHRIRPEVEDAGRFRWVQTRDEANTGVYSHTLLTYVCGDDKPMLVLAPHGDQVRVSSRGSPRLFLAGVDLSIAVGRAASGVGGTGGGHPGAAGATVPAARRDEFFRLLDERLTDPARRPQ